MANYDQTVESIRAVCKTIRLNFEKGGDGRLASATKEGEYLNLLQRQLIASNPDYKIAIAPVREWYDVKINEIHINLKLTTGSSDNAFSKPGIFFTLCGTVPKSTNGNFNKLLKDLKALPKKSARDRATEYHYLAVDKNTGDFLFKSILDIYHYTTNPSNTLQINWKNEFAHADYEAVDFKAKVRELLKAVQTSVRQEIAGMKEFAEADIDTEFL
jgi:hypothetical protein